MVALAVGTESNGGIIRPADKCSVVGLKPTFGLTSTYGIIPLSACPDSVGPICRTVTDAVHVLDTIVEWADATSEASEFIPRGGYKQFLRLDLTNRKKLGIVRAILPEPNRPDAALEPDRANTRLMCFAKLREFATIVDIMDHISEIPFPWLVLDPFLKGDQMAFLAALRLSLDPNDSDGEILEGAERMASGFWEYEGVAMKKMYRFCQA